MALIIVYEYWDDEKTRIKAIIYKKDGKLHRPWQEGPAFIKYFNLQEDNRIKLEEYYENGLLHRPYKEGPARIEYSYGTDNRVWREYYYENGLCHRPYKEGPAIKAYNNKPDIFATISISAHDPARSFYNYYGEHYYENGKRYIPPNKCRIGSCIIL